MLHRCKTRHSYVPEYMLIVDTPKPSAVFSHGEAATWPRRIRVCDWKRPDKRRIDRHGYVPMEPNVQPESLAIIAPLMRGVISTVAKS